jgi:hypothetical protein
MMTRYPGGRRPLVIPCITLDGDAVRAHLGLPRPKALRAADGAVAAVIEAMLSTVSITQNGTTILVDPDDLGRRHPKSAVDAAWRGFIHRDRHDVLGPHVGGGAPHGVAISLLRQGRHRSRRLLGFRHVLRGGEQEWVTRVDAFMYDHHWATVVAWDADDALHENPPPMLLGFIRRHDLLRGVGTVLAQNQYCWFPETLVQRQQSGPLLGRAFLECARRVEALDGSYAPTKLAEALCAAPESAWRQMRDAANDGIALADFLGSVNVSPRGAS